MEVNVSFNFSKRLTFIYDNRFVNLADRNFHNASPACIVVLNDIFGERLTLVCTCNLESCVCICFSWESSMYRSGPEPSYMSGLGFAGPSTRSEKQFDYLFHSILCKTFVTFHWYKILSVTGVLKYINYVSDISLIFPDCIRIFSLSFAATLFSQFLLLPHA